MNDSDQKKSPLRWRWVTDDGKVMTHWSDKPPPPEWLRYAEDERGSVHVEFEYPQP